MEGMLISPYLWENLGALQTSGVVTLVHCETWKSMEGQQGSEIRQDSFKIPTLLTSSVFSCITFRISVSRSMN